jgi:hypothetical protein
VQSLQAQVKALEAAEASSKLALEATQLGYKVGVRVNLDVLNAQTQLFSTQRDLAKARYDVLVTSLKLRQAAGQLQPRPTSTRSTRCWRAECRRALMRPMRQDTCSASAALRRALIGLREALTARLTHGRTSGRWPAMRPRATASSMSGHPGGSALFQRHAGRLGEVEGVRPHHQRAAAGGGLDQVLPAQRRKAAAQQRHVGQA